MMTRKQALYARPTARAQTGMKLVEDPAERFVYAMCDGTTDLSSPVFLPAHRSALARLLKRGVVRRCPKGFQGTQPDIDGVLFSITGRCNMRCRHCYMGAPEGQGELSLDNMQRILDALCASGATQISLTGGEPLMRTDLMELIDSILARGMAIPDIFTNATLIDDAFVAELAARGLDPIFHVSFDGVGRHDVMRGVPGAENAARQGIAALKSAGHRVVLTTSVDENTLPALEKTYAFAKETGVHAWGVSPGSHNCNALHIPSLLFVQILQNKVARGDALEPRGHQFPRPELNAPVQADQKSFFCEPLHQPLRFRLGTGDVNDNPLDAFHDFILRAFYYIRSRAIYQVPLRKLMHGFRGREAQQGAVSTETAPKSLPLQIICGKTPA